MDAMPRDVAAIAPRRLCSVPVSSPSPEDSLSRLVLQHLGSSTGGWDSPVTHDPPTAQSLTQVTTSQDDEEPPTVLQATPTASTIPPPRPPRPSSKPIDRPPEVVLRSISPATTTTAVTAGTTTTSIPLWTNRAPLVGEGTGHDAPLTVSTERCLPIRKDCCVASQPTRTEKEHMIQPQEISTPCHPLDVSTMTTMTMATASTSGNSTDMNKDSTRGGGDHHRGDIPFPDSNARTPSVDSSSGESFRREPLAKTDRRFYHTTLSVEESSRREKLPHSASPTVASNRSHGNSHSRSRSNQSRNRRGGTRRIRPTESSSGSQRSWKECLRRVAVVASDSVTRPTPRGGRRWAVDKKTPVGKYTPRHHVDPSRFSDLTSDSSLQDDPPTSVELDPTDVMDPHPVGEEESPTKMKQKKIQYGNF